MTPLCDAEPQYVPEYLRDNQGGFSIIFGKFRVPVHKLIKTISTVNSSKLTSLLTVALLMNNSAQLTIRLRGYTADSPLPRQQLQLVLQTFLWSILTGLL